MTEKTTKNRSWLKIGCLGVLGVFAALVVLAAIGSALMSPEEKARLAAEREAEAAQSAAESQAQAAAGLASFKAGFAKLAVPCDAAQAAVGAGLQNLIGGDRVALATDVRRMEGACGDAWRGVGDLDQPDGLTDAQEDAFKAVQEDCKMAFYSRKALAAELVPVVDGDTRPSVIAGLQEGMRGMQAEVLKCQVALLRLDPPAAVPGALAK